MNGNYFSRTYAKQYPGNPLIDTLQPYLVDITTGLLTTIRTVSAYNNQPYTGVQIKVYQFIGGLGRTYVEEVVTDYKGEALTLLITGDSYEFEIYIDGVYIRTDEITATSSVIYIRIEDMIYENPLLESLGIQVTYDPLQSNLGLLTTKLL